MSQRSVSIVRGVAAGLPAVLMSPALARPQIGPGDFSGHETRIDFDNLAAGQVITNQYAALGITFNNPDFTTTANSSISALITGHTLPNVAFVDQGGGSAHPQPQQLLFSVPVNRVGMFWAGSGGSSIRLQVFGASGLLETLILTGTPNAIGVQGYVGLQRPELIVHAEVSSISADPNQGPLNFVIDDLQFESAGGCYANCDGSTTAPVLNVLDFGCFLNRFAAGDTYANCDGSTTPPVLNVLDFGCFLNRFAAGCS